MNLEETRRMVEELRALAHRTRLEADRTGSPRLEFMHHSLLRALEWGEEELRWHA